MGYAHIVTIHEDGIREAKSSSGFDPEYVQSTGLGVLTLCLEPTFGEDANGRFRITWQQVGHLQNCLNWIGQVHSSEVHLFLWSGNSLRNLRNATIDELREAQKEISKILEIKEAESSVSPLSDVD